LSFADWIRVITAAARCPLLSEPANNQFEHLCCAQHNRDYAQYGI